ncbi:bifunctional SulP family inorganic anion transporter/carbonic anhydrase [Streptomyces cavourensis]|uniref:bifunctional SulP family inorganic anion transporter/carbonic anhydrase n=1 Tax=Streptomyces cavourensis TaxID=67258 RepID=UPI003976D518
MSACTPTRHDRASRGTPRPSPRRPPRLRPRIPAADVSASITVLLIAVPMALGLSLAVGAPLEAGLVAAAVGGIVAGLFGGAPLQVSGPSAGLTVVTAELIQIYGWRTTCAITIGAGLLQILLGTLRVARNALAVSPAIVHGTLAGIVVAIALAQLHIMLGGSPQSSVVANALALSQQLAVIGGAAPLIGALTIAVVLLWPRLPGRVGRAARRIPAALASVVIATAVAAVAAPGLARIDLPSWRSHAFPELPHGPVLALATAVFTVMLVAGLESLLAAAAVDRLAADRAGEPVKPSSPTSGSAAAVPPQRSDLDRELRGPGVANTLSGLLGGLPVAGGVVRGAANVRAGATGRASSVLHGVWVLLAAALLVTVFEWIPLAALAALVMVVGVQMVSFAHIRNVHKHREFPVYAATVAGVIGFGALAGVALGVAVAVVLSLHRLGRTRITVSEQDGRHVVTVHGQLTFLSVPRLTRALGQLPPGADATVELDGSFMDHAAYEAIQAWRGAQIAQGGSVAFTGGSGGSIALAGRSDGGVALTGRSGGVAAPTVAAAHSCCRPWTPWRNHHCHDRPTSPTHTTSTTSAISTTSLTETVTFTPDSAPDTARPESAHRLRSGLTSFQRNTAPLVRDELARLASEGQSPSQLFITCADSRLVTSMITASGPGDLFTVRNVGNLIPPPHALPTDSPPTGTPPTDAPGTPTAPATGGDDSVAAAIEYAVEVLRVESITVCGHSGCGAMQALLRGEPEAGPDRPRTPLWRWLRHGLPSLERMASRRHSWARISGRLPADEVEQLCLTNVVQQLEHLRAHKAVARRLAEGTLQLHGMYFDVGEAQAYLLPEGADCGTGHDEVFDRVGTEGPEPAAARPTTCSTAHPATCTTG